MGFLQWLTQILVGVLNWIWVAILNIGVWNNNPNAAPARMRGRMRYFIGSAIFLLVLSIGGAIIHNVWLMVLPWMLGTLLVYLAIPGLSLALNTAGRSSDAKQNIKLAFQGVFGWMFWIWGACTWLIMYPPWPAALWSLVLLCIFLTFSFLCRFLGTPRIASKVAFFAILCLAFAVRFSGISNNEFLQEIKESVASRAHHWVTRDKISRAERGVSSKANEIIADTVSQQKIQDKIYLVYEGSPIRNTQGEIKYYADEVLYVALADNQPPQPGELIGEYWLFYLPDLELTQFKRNFSGDPITRRAKPVIRCSARQFVKKEGRKVWISSADVDLSVEIKEAREPRVRSSVRNTTGNPGNSTHQARGSFLERVRIDKDQALWYGLWLGAALIGVCVVRKKLKDKTIRAIATVLLVLIVVWLGFAGLDNSFSLAAPRDEPENTVFNQTSPFYGFASYYGDGEDLNEKTASLEIFDPAKLTAAHRTLPFDTFVRVINTDDRSSYKGSSVVVRVNDRGPADWPEPYRDIDLTLYAFEAIAEKDLGLIQVKMEALSQVPAGAMVRRAGRHSTTSQASVSKPDRWQVVDRISATSLKLAEGVALPDGDALTLRWPRWGFLRFRVVGSNNSWAQYLPWGDNYYVGFKNNREMVLHGGMKRYFENNGLPGYAVCLAQGDELIKSWPLTLNQLPENNATGIDPDVIDLPVFRVPAGTGRMLRVNKPLDIKAGIEWDDDFLIILEVVEYQTSYGAFEHERPFLFYIVRLRQLLL